MLTIGLTGPSGAGKGTVASLFAAHGVPSIDTDKVYHDLLIPPSACLDELSARFGTGILTPDGMLNRGALAAIVFAEGVPAVLVDAPQLFESGFDAECGFILSVLAPYELRLARIMARDGLDEARAKARLDASHTDDFFRERSDAVMINDGALDAMEAEVRRLLTAWEVDV